MMSPAPEISWEAPLKLTALVAALPDELLDAVLDATAAVSGLIHAVIVPELVSALTEPDTRVRQMLPPFDSTSLIFTQVTPRRFSPSTATIASVTSKPGDSSRAPMTEVRQSLARAITALADEVEGRERVFRSVTACAAMAQQKWSA